jgi:hypothetical protein
MKTTSQIYEQQNKIYSLLYNVTSQNINRVNPETGGNLHLAHNWGNDEAQKYLEQYNDRSSFLFRLINKHYHIAFCAQYPDHLTCKI